MNVNFVFQLSEKVVKRAAGTPATACALLAQAEAVLRKSVVRARTWRGGA
jgi:hypothetical protein